MDQYIKRSNRIDNTHYAYQVQHSVMPPLNRMVYKNDLPLALPTYSPRAKIQKTQSTTGHNLSTDNVHDSQLSNLHLLEHLSDNNRQDDRKAFDSVPHSWNITSLRLQQ